MSRRAQSTVVGVVVLLAMTVLSLTALSVAVGTVVEEGASAAQTRQVGATFESAFDPEASGPRERRLALSGGRLRTVDRSVRLVTEMDGDPVAEWSVGGLVYTAGRRQVRHVAGATVSDHGSGATLDDPPDVATRGRSLFVDVPILDTAPLVVTGDTAVGLQTNVTHRRRHLVGTGFGVALETDTPAPFERWFSTLGATTTRRSFDGDGVDSVVAYFPSVRDVYLFVHDMHLEVAGGG